MTSEMEANLLIRFGEFRNPLPPINSFSEFCKFEERAMIGREFRYPVYLGLPHSLTHNKDRTAFTIQSVISPVEKEATVTSSELLFNDNVSYGDMFAAGNGAAASQMSAEDYKVLGLLQAGEFWREMELHYGAGPTSTAATNIGVVASATGTNLGSGMTIKITRASYIPGAYPLMTNAKVDVYQSDSATLRAADAIVTAPVESSNQVTLTKAASVAVVAVNDVIVSNTALAKSMIGFEAQAQNTSTQFGIDAGQYPQWKWSQYALSSAGPLTRRDVINAMSKQVPRGVKNGGVLWVSGPTMGDLIDEATELQRFLDEGEVKVQGASSVNYKTPGGRVDVRIDPVMKQGVALFAPQNVWKRCGSTDLTFASPMNKNKWFLSELSGAAGSNMRLYGDMAGFANNPWQCVYFTNLQNSGDSLPA